MHNISIGFIRNEEKYDLGSYEKTMPTCLNRVKVTFLFLITISLTTISPLTSSLDYLCVIEMGTQ